MFAALLCSLALASQAEPAPVEPTPAPPAPAVEASTFDALFDEARRLYDRFEFEKASFKFRASSRAPGLDAASAARANLWCGLAEAQAGDDSSARDSFVRALRIDATLTLPADAPPTLIPLFDQARASASPASNGASHADTSPPKSSARSDSDLSFRAVAPWVGAALGGGGLLLGVGGGLMGTAAVARADEAQKARFASDAAVWFEEAETSATLASVLVVAGIASLTAGTTIAVVGSLLPE